MFVEHHYSIKCPYFLLMSYLKYEYNTISIPRYTCNGSLFHGVGYILTGKNIICLIVLFAKTNIICQPNLIYLQTLCSTQAKTDLFLVLYFVFLVQAKETHFSYKQYCNQENYVSNIIVPSLGHEVSIKLHSNSFPELLCKNFS